jgi:hypothetical protein
MDITSEERARLIILADEASRLLRIRPVSDENWRGLVLLAELLKRLQPSDPP